MAGNVTDGGSGNFLVAPPMSVTEIVLLCVGFVLMVALIIFIFRHQWTINRAASDVALAGLSDISNVSNTSVAHDGVSNASAHSR